MNITAKSKTRHWSWAITLWFLSALRSPLFVALMLCITWGGAVAVSRFTFAHTDHLGAVKNGVWVSFPALQTADADPYSKVHRARRGALLYGTAEALRLSASTDDQGQPLTPACSYELKGQMPPARFWTLFAANQQGEPPAIPSDVPTALNSASVMWDAENKLLVSISAQAQPGNWLGLRTKQPFELVLTLFDTPLTGKLQLTQWPMPALVKTGCRHV